MGMPASTCWLWMAALASVCLYANPVAGALPPGFDEELYCPAAHCLRDKDPRPMMPDPRAMFSECAHITTGAVSNLDGSDIQPAAWGKLRGIEAKQKLLDAGYTTSLCELGTPRALNERKRDL